MPLIQVRAASQRNQWRVRGRTFGVQVLLDLVEAAAVDHPKLARSPRRAEAFGSKWASNQVKSQVWPIQRMPAKTWNQRRARFSHSLGTGSKAPPPLEDLQERAALDLFDAQARARGLVGGEGPAEEAAQEEVEQALSGRGVVEDLAEESGLRGLLGEGMKATRGGIEALEEERVDRGVARGKLGGMEVPALVVGVDQGVADVVVVQAPGAPAPRCGSHGSARR